MLGKFTALDEFTAFDGSTALDGFAAIDGFAVMDGFATLGGFAALGPAALPSAIAEASRAIAIRLSVCRAAGRDGNDDAAGPEDTAGRDDGNGQGGAPAGSIADVATRCAISNVIWSIEKVF